MEWKRYTTEQIVPLLRETEVRLAQGDTIGGICRRLGCGNRVITAGAVRTAV